LKIRLFSRSLYNGRRGARGEGGGGRRAYYVLFIPNGSAEECRKLKSKTFLCVLFIPNGSAGQRAGAFCKTKFAMSLKFHRF